MLLRRVCQAFAAGAFVAAAAGAATAGGDCCNAAPAPCAPVTTCKVTCVQYVPERVPVTRTTYKVQCREEAYTAYRCVTVPETRVCTRTDMKPVCETVMETRTVCERVPCTEQRTCWKTCLKTVPVTEVKRVMVDRGHYECRECPAEPTLLERLCHKKNDCGCLKMVTKKVWVPCMVCEEKTVTRCQRVCERVPVTVNVTTCKIIPKTVTVPCTRV